MQKLQPPDGILFFSPQLVSRFVPKLQHFHNKFQKRYLITSLHKRVPNIRKTTKAVNRDKQPPKMREHNLLTLMELDF